MVDPDIEKPLKKKVFKIIVHLDIIVIMLDNVNVRINTVKVYNDLLYTLTRLTRAYNKDMVYELFKTKYKNRDTILLYIDYLYALYNRNNTVPSDEFTLLKEKMDFVIDIHSIVFYQIDSILT